MDAVRALGNLIKTAIPASGNCSGVGAVGVEVEVLQALQQADDGGLADVRIPLHAQPLNGGEHFDKDRFLSALDHSDDVAGEVRSRVSPTSGGVPLKATALARYWIATASAER